MLKQSTHILIVILCISCHVYALEPRTLPPKPAMVVQPEGDSDLIVKFKDELRVRAIDGNLSSNVSADLTAVMQVQQQFELLFEQSIDVPQETLDFVETRAAQTSGVAQPDYASFMIVTGPPENLADAANALLVLDEVEWVEFEGPVAPGQCDDIPPTTPNYFVQGRQSYHGINPGVNMPCGWIYGGRGQGVRFAV